MDPKNGPPGRNLRMLFLLAAALTAFGCAEKPKPVVAPPKPPPPEVFTPYVPATRPAEPITDVAPQHPADAKPAITLLYSIEVWEIQLPRFTVSTDDAFWKHVNEQALDLPTYDVLFKNGVRVGEIPVTDLSAVSKLIEDRKGTRTTINGMAGKQMELPIASNVPTEVLFYVNRANNLIGRSYDRCDNIMAFSFESTPRNPDQIRLAFTPVVRAHDKKLVYTMTPGKTDREVGETYEEMHYDVGLSTDLPLQSALVVAPSIESRTTTSIGSRFLVIDTPSEQRERLLVVIPHAYQRAADKP